MALDVYTQLGLGAPKLTIIHLLLVDHIVKRPMDILYDVLVKEENLPFLLTILSLTVRWILWFS